MKITFCIDKERVFDEVAKTTAYVGTMADAYELISTVDANKDILTSFMESACNELMCALGAYNAMADSGDEEEDAMVVTAEVPKSFDMNKRVVITRLMHEYLTCALIWKWLYMSLPEKGAAWEMKMTEVKGKIVSYMNARTAWVKKKMQPF